MKNFNSKKIYDLLFSKEIKPLDSEFEIEDLLIFINSLDQKIDFFEGLKKDRVAKIEGEIVKIEEQKRLLKQVIHETLKSISKKSLKFPGIGKVFIKEMEGRWNISNENDLIDFLKKELPPADFNKLVSTKPVIAKRDLNDLLEMWNKVGKTPSCVSREPDTSTITVKIDDDVEEVPDTEPSDESSVNNFDTVDDLIVKEGEL